MGDVRLRVWVRSVPLHRFGCLLLDRLQSYANVKIEQELGRPLEDDEIGHEDDEPPKEVVFEGYQVLVW